MCFGENAACQNQQLRWPRNSQHKSKPRSRLASKDIERNRSQYGRRPGTVESRGFWSVTGIAKVPILFRSVYYLFMKNFTLLRRSIRLGVFVLAITVSGFSAAAHESKSVASTVDAFHNALRRGDGAAAMKLLAPDAIILEDGAIETRAEYESHHLSADMAFAKAVPSTRSNVRVQMDGNTAWLSSASRTEGSFQKRPINNRGAELIVLTKGAEGWRIRAIHWSSQKVTKPQ